MLATRVLRNLCMSLLANDPGSLAEPVLPNVMRLAMNDFAPSEQLTIADVVEAVFPGYAGINIAVGAQPEGYDPTTDASVIDLKAPIGGFRWITSSAPASPVTIYGFYFTDNGSLGIYASERFATPIVLSLAAQVVDIGDARLSLQPNSVT